MQGMMISHEGANPYTSAPSEHFTGDVLRNIPWVDQKSPYGPLALFGFAAATSLNGGIVSDFWCLKILTSLPWFIMLGILAASGLFPRGERPLWFAWIALNPLLVLEVCQNGHLEGWVGLLLFFLSLALLEVTRKRAILAGVLFGLACAVKLSVIVALPVVLVRLLFPSRSRTGPRRVSETAWMTSAFLVPMFLTLIGLYAPLWQGVQTFAGIGAESGKIIRSFYSVLVFQFGMTPGTAYWCGYLGNLCAALAGMYICIRRRSFAEGLMVLLLIQAVFGRTFLQPWYFCPLVMLAPLLGIAHGKPEDEFHARLRTRAETVVLDLILVLSASAVAGGYAVIFLAKKMMMETSFYSVMWMIAPPLLMWAAEAMASRYRQGAGANAGSPRHGKR
jgi:hypothetical protein